MENPPVIRAAGQGAEGRQVVILGLDGENITRLLAAEPIRVNLRRLLPDQPDVDELPDVDIVIFYTKDPDDAMRQLHAHVRADPGGRPR